jgi:hypothetical protein
VAEHLGHDPLLVAAAADRGGRLAEVIAACAECVTLLRDLRVLALAAPAAAIPRRPRDLRLTIDDARRLRQRGWRRILAGFGAGRDAVTRPLAMGLTTLGLVGLLLGSVQPGPPFAGAGGSDMATGDTTQPLRTTGAPGTSEAAGSPERVPEDASVPGGGDHAAAGRQPAARGVARPAGARRRFRHRPLGVDARERAMMPAGNSVPRLTVRRAT